MTTPTITPTPTPTFDPEVEAIRAEWPADLRAEGALQAKGQLRDPKTGGMCCLGHLGNGLLERHSEWLEANGFKVEIGQFEHGVPVVGAKAGMRITDLRVVEDKVFNTRETHSYTAIPVRLAELLGLRIDGSDAHYGSTFTECKSNELPAGSGDRRSLAGLNDYGRDGNGESLSFIATKIEEVLYK